MKTKLNTATIVRTALLLLALVNQLLQLLGKPLLPIEDEQLSQLITLLMTAGTSLWAWWSNNSITKEAQAADQVLAALKAGKVKEEELRGLLGK